MHISWYSCFFRVSDEICLFTSSVIHMTKANECSNTKTQDGIPLSSTPLASLPIDFNRCGTLIATSMLSTIRYSINSVLAMIVYHLVKSNEYTFTMDVPMPKLFLTKWISY